MNDLSKLLEIIKPALTSKRFLAIVASIIFVIAHDKLGVNVTEEQVLYVVTLAVTLVIGDSWRPIDPAKALKQVSDATLQSAA